MSDYLEVYTLSYSDDIIKRAFSIAKIVYAFDKIVSILSKQDIAKQCTIIAVISKGELIIDNNCYKVKELKTASFIMTHLANRYASIKDKSFMNELILREINSIIDDWFNKTTNAINENLFY